MSSLRLQEERLRQRRETLRLQCGVQRQQMIRRGGEMQAVFHLLDVAGRAAQGARRHPVLVLGSLAAIVAIVRPRRVVQGVVTVLGAVRAMNTLSTIRHRVG